MNRYCLLGNLVEECPEGHFCPAGTRFDWQQCPPGTYNNETALQASTDCKQCPGGYYCQDHGLVEPSGKCDPGYYCEYGVDRARPTGTENATLIGVECVVPGGQTGEGDVCPMGSYCPLGSTLPMLCLAGSYSNQTGLAQCLECPEGYYCENGMTARNF
jgi:hypothetical protein